jgi:hypothetical protein
MSLRIRSSISSSDIWQPKQPASEAVAIFGFAISMSLKINHELFQTLITLITLIFN